MLSTSYQPNSNSNKPKSISFYQQHLVTPSVLSYCMQNLATMTDYRDCLDAYYLKYWSASHLISQIKGGTIRQDNIDYQVYFSPKTNRGQILQESKSPLTANNQYRLSFRKPSASFGSLLPVVFISF